MIKVKKFNNQLMSSVCYLVYDEMTKKSIIIDPGSEKSICEIEFIEDNSLVLDYVFLTHEHTDHTWGVNSLIERYPTVKIVCSEYCKLALPKETRNYFQYYYDNKDYSYNVARVDYTTENMGNKLLWDDIEIHFYNTPGHCKGSICIEIDGLLFSGDTLMPYKPFVKRQLGGSIEDYKKSLLFIQNIFSPTTLVYPGHGDVSSIQDILSLYRRIFVYNL